MKNNPWMEFLVFTRKERIAVFVLSLLIIGTAIAPVFIPEKKFITPNAAEFYGLKGELDKLRSTSNDTIAHSRNENQPWQINYSLSRIRDNGGDMVLFPFDPNKISTEEWKKLGLRDRTIKTITNFRSKGGKFRQATDLKKIYGLKEEEFQRLLPYVRLEEKDEIKYENVNYENKRKEGSQAPKITPIKPYSIEINKADTTELIALPGIGNKLANRIINFRSKLGGFYSVEQLHEVYGLPDSTFKQLKTYLTCNPALVNKININDVDLETLKQHPYIKWNLANAIVQYRKEHGNFNKPEDLKQIALMDELLYQKILHYLHVD